MIQNTLYYKYTSTEAKKYLIKIVHQRCIHALVGLQPPAVQLPFNKYIPYFV